MMRIIILMLRGHHHIYLKVAYPATPAWCEMKMREVAMAKAWPRHNTVTKIPLLPTPPPLLPLLTPPSSRHPCSTRPPPAIVSGMAENASKHVPAPRNT